MNRHLFNHPFVVPALAGRASSVELKPGVRTGDVCILFLFLFAALLSPRGHAQPLQLSVANPATFELSVSGPPAEMFVAEWTSNLVHWTIWHQGEFSAFTPTQRIPPPPLGSSIFCRARRVDPPESCGEPLCFHESTGPTCPSYGPPDEPASRNAAIPTSGTPVKTIRLLVQILARDDCSRPAATEARVREQIETLNRHFLPHRIQFVFNLQTNCASRFRQLFSRAHADDLMTNLAVQPEIQHNVFVTDTPPDILGYSTYPWLTNEAGQFIALSPLGSTVVSPRRFGSNEFILTHELGHALGLWHTHHGSESAFGCATCWERADGLDADRTGDRCSDTPPTPLDVNCQLPYPYDPCTGVAWPLAGANNFMSAAPWCNGRFTPQQAGRMHAWIDYRLSGWLDTNTPATPSAFVARTNVFGEVELAWTDNAWNETGYIIERLRLDGGVESSTNLPAGTTQFLDATASTNYNYRVRAVNGAFESYATVVPARTSIAPLIFCIDPAVPAACYPTLQDAYDAATRPAILRFAPGRYTADAPLSKILRLERVNGPVVLERR